MRHPERVANYRIVQRVGRGAAGRTYIAVRAASSHEVSYVVCLKTPPPRFANDPAYVQDFENEARMASALQHPHIVPLQDHGLDVDRDIRFLAFRYVEGPDLSEIIKGHAKQGKQMPWPAVATWAVQIAHALHCAHADTRDSGRLKPRAPIIHRDICPANILIALSGVSYLTDFGLARAIDSASLMPSLAGTGRIAYTAPERLIDGRRYDARADLFSYGVVLFEALTNKLPYDARSSASYIRQALSGEHPRVRDLRREWDPAMEPFAAIVERLLEPDPDQRFLSAGEVIYALGQIHIPPSGFRQLAEAAEEHMPLWRRNVRLRSTGEMPSVQPAIPRSMWHRTDPHQIPHLLAAGTLDPDRDFIRVGPKGAERLLAQRHVPLSTTLPGYTADPASLNFGVTDPDRPTFDIEESQSDSGAGEHVLTPPPFLDGSSMLDASGGGPSVSLDPLAMEPWIPETRDRRPAFDPERLAAMEHAIGPAPAQPTAVRRPTPAHTRVATSLPAYELSEAGLRPVKRTERARSSRRRWIFWAVGVALLALLALPCAVFAGLAAMGATGGAPRSGASGAGSSEDDAVTAVTRSGSTRETAPSAGPPRSAREQR